MDSGSFVPCDLTRRVSPLRSPDLLNPLSLSPESGLGAGGPSQLAASTRDNLAILSIPGNTQTIVWNGWSKQ